MSISLPDRPSLRHLKSQAKDLVKSGAVESTNEALFQIARRYGFPSWPKLKAHVDRVEQLHRALDVFDSERITALLNDQEKELIASGAATSIRDARSQIATIYGLSNWTEVEALLKSMGDRGASFTDDVQKLKRAIDDDDVETVKTLMTQSPNLHRAPLGYGNNGPLTWASECRGAPPRAARLAIAKWMIDNGSDIHQGGDGPLMRAALNHDRIPMMELLVSNGADVNAEWNGEYPIIFAPCETVDPKTLTWLLGHGANPNCDPGGRFAGTALDFVIASYERSADLTVCIDILLSAGGTTKYDAPAMLDLLRDRIDLVKEHLDNDPSLIESRFPALDFGTTGGRMLTLKGATLLHAAAEYRRIETATLLLDRGANVNARAAVDEAGVGGQTSIFHAATQRSDAGLPIVQVLTERGTDLSIRAKVPGHYERPGEVIECTVLGYALRFENEPCRADKTKTVQFLRDRGAPT